MPARARQLCTWRQFNVPISMQPVSMHVQSLYGRPVLQHENSLISIRTARQKTRPRYSQPQQVGRVCGTETITARMRPISAQLRTKINRHTRPTTQRIVWKTQHQYGNHLGHTRPSSTAETRAYCTYRPTRGGDGCLSRTMNWMAHRRTTDTTFSILRSGKSRTLCGKVEEETHLER